MNNIKAAEKYNSTQEDKKVRHYEVMNIIFEKPCVTSRPPYDA